ncbi:hypothetical protein SETIT_4G028700v2 [Setaria italica]|uniref:Uncharacterized protein n=1 Tax=Setaria italica TaxID=4555 RepID=A0A368QS48_SETIT|nr:hypothetical protein SETIT_4G028700v2 [Setaria italica]
MDTALTRISISILMAATGGAHRSSAGRRRDDTGGSPSWVSSPGRHGRLVDADPSVGPSGVGRMLLADADRVPGRASRDRRPPAPLPFRSRAAGATSSTQATGAFSKI